MRWLVLVIALCGTAHAQAPGETPPRPEGSHKSILSAYLVTAAATTLPLTVAAIGAPDNEYNHPTRAAVFGSLGIAAAVLGPTAGHWYAGEGMTTGLALRLTGAAGVGALVLADPHGQNLGLLITGGVVCAGLWEVGAIWDLATVPRAVRHYNRQRDLQIAPMAAPHTTGLALAGTF